MCGGGKASVTKLSLLASRWEWVGDKAEALLPNSEKLPFGVRLRGTSCRFGCGGRMIWAEEKFGVRAPERFLFKVE